VYALEIKPGAESDIQQLRPFERSRVVDAIRSRIADQPQRESRNRKSLTGDFPGHDEVWEYRLGDLRIFYDVDEEAHLVRIQAVRRKRSDQRTQDIFP